MQTIESFRPLNGWVLVSVDEDDHMTESGLLHRPGIPGHILQRGTVIKASPVTTRVKRGASYRHGKFDSPLKAGMRILFSYFLTDKYYWVQFREMFGKRYALLKPEDVQLYDCAGEGLGIDDIKLSGQYIEDRGNLRWRSGDIKFMPVYDRVLVYREKGPLETDGGIVIPDKAQKKSIRGEVISVGGGKMVNGQARPLGVVGGDTVVFQRHSGTDIKLDGEDLVILREEEILGVCR